MHHKSFMEETGELIRFFREKKQMTQEDLAGKLGTDRNVISSYELGKKEPSAIRFMTIAKELDVPIDSLVPVALRRTQDVQSKVQMISKIKEIIKDAESALVSATDELL